MARNTRPMDAPAAANRQIFINAFIKRLDWIGMRIAG